MQTLKNGSKIDGFLILRLIARGGMGEVYEAYEEALDRKVALKIVTPSTTAKQSKDLLRRFKREAKILAKVNHPNIVTVYGIKASDDGIQYLSMELVEGVSFKDFIKDFDLPLGLAVHLFTQSLAAVQVLHACGIIHRDLKPSNILFLKSGEIKILDFGIAKMEGIESDTNPGLIVGSVPYMAPEINDGYKAGWRTECWSMGAVLYEIVTREMLFHRVKDGEVKFSDQDCEWIPGELLSLISKACAKNPEARYKDSYELMADLKVAAATLPQVTEQDRLRLQGRVKELINRARSHSDVDVPAPLPVERTMLPPVPDDAHNFFSATIVQRKLTQIAIPRKPNAVPPNVREKTKLNLGWPQYGGALGVLAALGFFLFGPKDLGFVNNLQSTMSKTGFSQSEVLNNFNKSSSSETKVVTASNDVKPVEPVKVVEAPKPAEVPSPAETPNQLLYPVEGDPIIVDGNFLDFKWSQPVSNGQFTVELARDAGFDQIVFQKPANGTNFIWKKKINPGPYFWRLKPNKGRGGKDLGVRNFMVMNSFAIQTDHPTQKQEFSVTEGHNIPVEFKWDCKFGVEQYLIEVATTADFAKPVKSSTEKSCSWSAPLGDGNYFWRVRAAKPINEMDFASAVSKFQILKKAAPAKIAVQEDSNDNDEAKPARKTRAPAEAKKTVRLAKPAAALSSIKLVSPAKGAKAPTRNGQISIEFAWDPEPNTTKYVLELSSDPEFSDVIQKVESQDHRVLVEKIKQKGKVFWRVKAEGSSNPGWSEASFLELM